MAGINVNGIGRNPYADSYLTWIYVNTLGTKS